ncbi:MAG: hypothetical protein IJ915_02795 [Paludibacteraceae bacterium]|nr:hypothetical protein [Paludibacteraceae bacterium]
MANVDWSAGIDSVSGALAKPSKHGPHSCTKMLLGTHRVAATTNDNCTRIYLRKKVRRSTPVTAHERDIRNRFSVVATAVANRAQDLTQITQDQIAFNAQKDSAGGKKTMKKYLWSLEMATYDAAHPQP